MNALLPSRRRLWLERLEDRDAPATITLDVAYGTGTNVTLSGHLGDTTTPANQPISIGGVVMGMALTDADGDFELTVPALMLGNVTAKALDGSSNTASVTLTDSAPELTSFEAVEAGRRLWELRGTVTYSRYFESLTIVFGGQSFAIQNVQTTANENGKFSFWVRLTGDVADNGTVWAKAQSPWGLLSEALSDEIFQTGT